MGAHNHSDALLQGCGVLPQGGRHDGQLQVGLHDGRGALPAVERDAPPPLAVVAQFGPTLDHTIAAVGFVRGIKHIGAHRKAALPSTAWLSGAAGAGRGWVKPSWPDGWLCVSVTLWAALYTLESFSEACAAEHSCRCQGAVFAARTALRSSWR